MGLSLMDSKTVVVTQSMIDDFRIATRDTNKLHERYALGFQLEGLLYDFGQELYASKRPEFSCISIKTEFSNAVPSNTPVTMRVEKCDDTPAGGSITLLLHKTDAVRTCSIENVAATCTLNYATAFPFKPDSIDQKLTYTHSLLAEDATRAGLGLAKSEPDFLFLALGLMSKSLLDGWSDYVRQKTEAGQVPMYWKHYIDFAHASAPKTGDTLSIVPLDYKSRARMGNEWHEIRVAALNADTQVYSAKVVLVFKDPSTLRL